MRKGEIGSIIKAAPKGTRGVIAEKSLAPGDSGVYSSTRILQGGGGMYVRGKKYISRAVY